MNESEKKPMEASKEKPWMKRYPSCEEVIADLAQRRLSHLATEK